MKKFLIIITIIALPYVSSATTLWNFDNVSSPDSSDEFIIGSSARGGSGTVNISWSYLSSSITALVVEDETYSSANFDGDTTHCVSQDDFYDRMAVYDTDNDGYFTDEAWFASGTGDITDIFGCSAGDCSTLTAASGDSINMSSGTSAIPWLLKSDCSGDTTLGYACVDSDNGQVYVGDGSDANNIGPGVSLAEDGLVSLSLATDLTISVPAASASDVNTGTSTTTAITPDALAGSTLGTFFITLPVTSTASESLTTGDGKIYWTVPSDIGSLSPNLVSVFAAVYTVSSSGTPTFQIHNLTDTQDMLSTVLTIDASEYNSSTAATSAVINTSYDDLAAGDRIRIDCDVAGTGTAGGEVTIGLRIP